MDSTELFVTFIVLLLAAIFLALWHRRDRGDVPARDLAESPPPGRGNL